MPHEDILELARKIAARLGIRIKNSALILKNMKPKTGIATFLYNEDFILWIDKHYIAYSDKCLPEIVYVFADREHVSEELRSVCKRLRNVKSLFEKETLLSVKQQLQLASAAMSKSGSGLYFIESEE